MTPNQFPRVTIGIPTYNRADGYLRGCIESVVHQTYGNIEIIVSDNCSTDSTPELVNSIEEPRLRYFRHKENIGANNNFNYCLKQAKGDYFLLLSDDDRIDPDFVETCMHAADYQRGIGLIRSGTRIIDSTGRTVREIPNKAANLPTEDFFLSWFEHKTALYLCSTLFQTAHLKAIGGFQSRHDLFQDVIAEVQVAAAHGRVDVKDVKASFRKHEGEMTFGAKVKAWCEDSLDLLDLMCRLADNRKRLIRKTGMKFFGNLNFNRAMAVSPLMSRFKALITVLSQFGFRWFALRRFISCLRLSAAELLTGSSK